MVYESLLYISDIICHGWCYLKILIVSGEYPPMMGGVGRYTQNLVTAFKKKEKLDVHLAVGSLNNITSTSDNTYDESGVHYNIIKKGDRKNSDRLLDLIDRIRPDIINVQYERGLYEIDTTLLQIFKGALYRSTLDRFYSKSPVPIISTLHTIFPYGEYEDYIKERAHRKEGRFSVLPLFLRAPIRIWVLRQRYHYLLGATTLSDEIICLARTIRQITNQGTIIYHGAEPASSLISSAGKKDEFKNYFGFPKNKKLLLAFGYVGSYKGFDILSKLKLPEDWCLVVKQNTHDRGSESPVQVKNAIVLPLGHISDTELSRLFFACDAIIFPYRIVSVSGVLFEALAHGLPFIASELAFFREFAEMGLGITCSRRLEAFEDSIRRLSEHYDEYKKNVQEFGFKLRWNVIADNYLQVCSRLLESH